MFACFEAFIWVPVLVAAPADPNAWTPNAVNFALIGTVWVLADALSKRPRRNGYAGLPFFRSSAFLSTS
jgi:hypothetical protein